MHLYRRLKQTYRQLDPYSQWAIIVLTLAIGLRFLITFFVHAAGDSYAHLSTARFIAQTWTLPLFEPIYRPFFYYPPLFHIVSAGLYTLFSMFGESVATKAMDFVAALYGSAMLIVFWLFARKVVSTRIALWSLIFLAFVPLHLYYSTVAHVDIAAAFMALLVLWLLQIKHNHLGAIVNGLGMITKYTHLFVFPSVLVEFWQSTKNRKDLIKKLGAFFGISFLIGLPLYIRNYLYLGTPMWPFLNNVFKAIGMTPLLAETRPAASFAHFLDPSLPLRAYLDMFGVPLGLPQNLAGMPVIALCVWGTMTLMWSAPFVVGLFVRKPSRLMMLLWTLIGTYIAMLVYYVYDFGDLFMRLFLPAMPAIALIWAYGFEGIWNSPGIKRHKKLLCALLILLCIGFSSIEIFKAVRAAGPYERLEGDFTWIREHIPSHARFDRHSTYLLYHTNKQMTSQLCELEDYDQNLLYHYSDPHVEPFGPNSTYDSWRIVYENPATKVKVLKKKV